MASSVLGVKSFCIITGGSRGIGRAVALGLSSKFAADSEIVITGRSAPDLSETRRQIQGSAPDVNVKSVTADLRNQKTLSTAFEELTKDADPSNFQHALLINNAGAMADVTKFTREFDCSHYEYLQQDYALNLTSAFLLTAHFLRVFPAKTIRRTIVNVSSMAGIFPQGGLSVYAMNKAARTMLFKVIAKEEPDARVLNYSPGPVDTEMYGHFRKVVGQDTQDWIARLDRKQMMLKPDQTASMLIRILEDDAYDSGDHIDYYQYKKSKL